MITEAFNFQEVKCTLGLERVQNFRVRAEPSQKISSPSRAESKIFESEPSPSI